MRYPASIQRFAIIFGALATSAACTSVDKEPREFIAKEESRPNIIFVLADDLGYGDLGVLGQQDIATPNLDRMAREGVLLTDFYAGSTVCAPSRSVLMTGKHTGNTTVRGNSGSINPNLSESERLSAELLADEDVTVAEVLKGAGYRTAMIGKWGLGQPETSGHPNNQGFDYFFGYLDHVHAHNHYPDYLWRNSERVPINNTVSAVEIRPGFFRGEWASVKNVYSSDLFFEEAVDVVSADNDTPFFLYLALVSPHANNEAIPAGAEHGLEVPDLGQYAERDWNIIQQSYAAMVTRIDTGMGELLAALEERGIAEDTIVIFTSDNGPHSEGGYHPDIFDSNGIFRGQKRDLTEGGVRVPTLAWGPGRVPKAKVDNTPGYFADILPTFAALAHTSAPSGDGIDLSALITGRGTAPARTQPIYWEFYEQGSAQAIRDGKWKAIRKPMFSGDVVLYDLSVDPGETNNLAEQMPAQAARLAAAMDAAHRPDRRWLVP